MQRNVYLHPIRLVLLVRRKETWKYSLSFAFVWIFGGCKFRKSCEFASKSTLSCGCISRLLPMAGCHFRRRICWRNRLFLYRKNELTLYVFLFRLNRSIMHWIILVINASLLSLWQPRETDQFLSATIAAQVIKNTLNESKYKCLFALARVRSHNRWNVGIHRDTNANLAR